MIEQTQEVKRRPTTGAQASESAPLKKGNATWKPASLNVFYNKEAGYRYRMSRKDDKNLATKAQEGWETVDDSATTHQSTNKIEHGKPLTSIHEGSDWVLQKLPEELAKSRDHWHDDKNKRMVSGLTAHIKKEMKEKGLNAPVHGDITISSRKGTEIIE